MSEPSAEAVEAAASAVYGAGFDGSIQRDAWLADFRAALTAAYPFMVREAQATALEDAAKDFESKAKNIQNNAYIENPEFSLWLGWADTYERAARNLNDRAAAIRDGAL